MVNQIFVPTLSPLEDKILFLDIDGVLHPDDVASFTQDRTAPTGVNLFRWAPILVELLNKYPEVKIVVSSTWRCLFPYTILMDLLPLGIKERVIDVTEPKLYDRWDAIKEYIVRHKLNKYIIIDDDYKAFPYRCPELVRCYPNVGLSKKQTLDNLTQHLDRISS